MFLLCPPLFFLSTGLGLLILVLAFDVLPAAECTEFIFELNILVNQNLMHPTLYLQYMDLTSIQIHQYYFHTLCIVIDKGTETS